ncbi:uncharacterized protein Z520_03852 [Fonsecaea multimorphosa CBS 102226]|uniref:PXA domain-containing protein n=1 Tax=Fonsecaea multimorphosa CBS 102226 TaxID=1442371 RepID=A0A0D2IT85_9EURO|nr:uncharacterized protein Z520_03852 [Fonsecaea multimorphosa CBS 102226]KIY00167.1 hypothetical protein Z520_03852 [Fonsecaea multimorphosa CBS 102226]OAL27362.1 hypothetical protein AYO22_03637 [Fonsecaea multimorphosa]
MTASSSSPSRPPFPTIATKASSTSQSSQLTVVADSRATPGPRSTSRAPAITRSRQDASAPDPTSERATLSLIRRTLVADGSHGSDRRVSPAPIEGVLPPLTSSNEVDVQLYAVVAIVIKDFVNSWYSKITPDRTFVDEVIQIIAHCSRALEQRIRQVDITELILDELPVLVERHIAAYRTATTAQAALQYGETPRRIYHALNPHPALDPSLPPEQQQAYESAHRQLLIQGALAVLLPTEDLANACLRTLVSDIISDLILGQAVAAKLCEPWFLHGTVSKVVEIVTSPPTHASSTNAVNDQKILQPDRRQSRLEQFGLLSSNTATPENYSLARHQSSLSAWFWRLLQYAFIAYQLTRFILVGLAYAHHSPRRTRHQQQLLAGSTTPPSKDQLPVLSTRQVSAPDNRSPRAVINYRVFSCLSSMLDLAVRMPWLASSLGFWQHLLTTGPGRYGAANSTLDKFLYHTISTRLFSPALIPPLLLQIRVLIFPNNSLGPPPPPPPSVEEARKIRSKAASDILSLIPKPVGRTFFAVRNAENVEDEEMQMRIEVEERLLGWTDDAEMNKYLVYAILEHVLVKLVPEMKDKTPSELLAERGVDWVTSGESEKAEKWTNGT